MLRQNIMGIWWMKIIEIGKDGILWILNRGKVCLCKEYIVQFYTTGSKLMKTVFLRQFTCMIYLVHEYTYSEYHLCLSDCYTLTNTLLFSAIPIYPFEVLKHFCLILRGEQERVDSLHIDEHLLNLSQHFSWPCCQQLGQLLSNSFANNRFKIIWFLYLFMTSENSGSVFKNMYRV